MNKIINEINIYTKYNYEHNYPDIMKPWVEMVDRLEKDNKGMYTIVTELQNIGFTIHSIHYIIYSNKTIMRFHNLQSLLTIINEILPDGDVIITYGEEGEVLNKKRIIVREEKEPGVIIQLNNRKLGDEKNE